ncbi:hypothetical protein RIF29_08044 [Crotalaria pallida]|uniref:Uncharacterized protein n=1 Tax=Crotalaria pallida TaxID=3830 RepID=A0AAN9PBP7_CROPI
MTRYSCRMQKFVYAMQNTISKQANISFIGAYLLSLLFLTPSSPFLLPDQPPFPFLSFHFFTLTHTHHNHSYSFPTNAAFYDLLFPLFYFLHFISDLNHRRSLSSSLHSLYFFIFFFAFQLSPHQCLNRS